MSWKLAMNVDVLARDPLFPRFVVLLVGFLLAVLWLRSQPEWLLVALPLFALTFLGFDRLADGFGALVASGEMARLVVGAVLMAGPAAAPLRAPDLAGRCEIVGGDMVESVPGGGDAYLLKNVIHDWDDEQAVAILRNCAAAMAATGRILVVDIVLPPSDEPSPSRSFDLQMLAHHGRGRVRTEAEFRTLFAAADLRLTEVLPTRSVTNPLSILTGLPASAAG
jgi:hypothetical protein